MDGKPAGVRPLRERLPGYLIAFALGLAAGGLVGVVVWLATSVRIADAIGYAYSTLGALLLLTGGIRGSGYAGSGGQSEEVPGGRERPTGESPAAGARVGRAWPVGLDPVERRRRRITAAPDPAAFWQVVAGFAYLGVGVTLTLVLAAPAG
jgi:hypothetical protein